MGGRLSSFTLLTMPFIIEIVKIAYQIAWIFVVVAVVAVVAVADASLFRSRLSTSLIHKSVRILPKSTCSQARSENTNMHNCCCFTLDQMKNFPFFVVVVVGGDGGGAVVVFRRHSLHLFNNQNKIYRTLIVILILYISMNLIKSSLMIKIIFVWHESKVFAENL